jgi:hypothetical protein
MKNEIIQIAKDLEQGKITETEAQKLLSELFSVSVSDLDISEASVGENVDLFRKEGFIQGAKWLRRKLKLHLH